MTLNVAIFGVGPSGLAAASAILQHGGRVSFFGVRKEPSRLYGCQYLHAPIPGYEQVAHTSVDYRLVGTPEDYRRKVYGDDWDGKVSPEDLLGKHDAWDIRETYRLMWEAFIEKKNPNVTFSWAEIDWRFVASLQSERGYFDLMLSTIPAKAICFNPRHEFKSHTIFARGDTIQNPGPDRVVCNGTKLAAYYRFARVFGYRTLEFPSEPRDFDVSPVEKPLGTDCNCFPGVIRAGRYGVWDKSALVHHSYQQAKQFMLLKTDGSAAWQKSELHPNICRECARWGQSNGTYYVCQLGHTWGSPYVPENS